jgi:hypothetical protein
MVVVTGVATVIVVAKTPIQEQADTYLSHAEHGDA